MPSDDEYDYASLLQRSERLQKRMMEASLALGKTQLVGRGGSEVSLTIGAGGEPKEVRIDPAVVDPNDVGRLERLVMAALQDLYEQQSLTAQRLVDPLAELFNDLPK